MSLQLKGMTVAVKNHLDTVGLVYDRAVHCERSYYVPLQNILRNSIDESREALVTFADGIIDHLRNEVRHAAANRRLQPMAASKTKSRRS